jgi:hypothetical protein
MIKSHEIDASVTWSCFRLCWPFLQLEIRTVIGSDPFVDSRTICRFKKPEMSNSSEICAFLICDYLRMCG